MIIKAIQMDITKIGILADAIVNAANSSLCRGGGVCGSIFRAAGSELDVACAKLNGCKTGEAKATNAFKLENKYIIHTVGPDCRDERENNHRKELLRNAYLNSLKLADELGLESIAFPSISTGIYRFPIDEAVEICAQVVCGYQPKNLKRAYMCIWDPNNSKDAEYKVDLYNSAFEKCGKELSCNNK